MRQHNTQDINGYVQPFRFLLQFQHVEGQLVNLLRVAVEDSLDVGIRQVAAISFKNLVRKDWDPQGAVGYLPLFLRGDPCSHTLHMQVLSQTQN